MTLDPRFAARWIRERLSGRPAPEVGVILGSGLGGVAHCLEDAVEISQRDVPGFPAARVPGHRGVLAFGRLGGRPAMLSLGRAHLYEGHAPHEVAFVVHLMKELGVVTLCVTTAAGGIRHDLASGDLVLLTDQINLAGQSPLIGRPEAPPIEDLFVDMTDAFDPELRRIAREAAARDEIRIHEGVVAALRGPQFETPAEIRMLRTLGADLVCMSVACEVIAARSLGIRVLGIACVANPAAGVTGDPIRHEDVLRSVTARAETLGRLLASVAASAARP